MNIKKINEAISFLNDIAKEVDSLIYDLEAVEIKIKKLDQKSRLIKESAQYARNLIEWEINNTTLEQGDSNAHINNT